MSDPPALRLWGGRAGYIRRSQGSQCDFVPLSDPFSAKAKHRRAAHLHEHPRSRTGARAGRECRAQATEPRISFLPAGIRREAKSSRTKSGRSFAATKHLREGKVDRLRFHESSILPTRRLTTTSRKSTASSKQHRSDRSRQPRIAGASASPKLSICFSVADGRFFGVEMVRR